MTSSSRYDPFWDPFEYEKSLQKSYEKAWKDSFEAASFIRHSSIVSRKDAPWQAGPVPAGEFKMEWGYPLRNEEKHMPVDRKHYTVNPVFDDLTDTLNAAIENALGDISDEVNTLNPDQLAHVRSMLDDLVNLRNSHIRHESTFATMIPLPPEQFTVNDKGEVVNAVGRVLGVVAGGDE